MTDGSAVARARSFGSVAEQYERYRIGYPAEIVDVVLRHARRPVRSALEVGAGTGKATRVFAAGGLDVTALEPDVGMVGVLESTTGQLPVHVVTSTFEDFDPADRFDLVYAAAAWHWVDPATRWTRAVELLAPGGVLALFGRPCDPTAPDVRAAITQIEAEVLPGTPAGHPWGPADVAGTPGLDDAVEVHLPSADVLSAEDMVGVLGTVSAYLALPPSTRAGALARVRSVLPDRIEVDTTVHLLLARRV